MSASPTSSGKTEWAHIVQALQALYATVRSLAALEDIDDVLQEIVSNAHTLVATDVTHLSLINRETNQFVIRAVVGDVSDEFRRGRISIDLGVAGRVLATGRPFVATNYRESPEIGHDPKFDALMRREGLVALAGVPLRVGDDVFGVLHGSNRHSRPFHDDEIALLSAFADHAAVALDNARLYDQKTRALRELSEAYSTIGAHVNALERAAVVHDAMTSLVLSGGTTQAVADLLHIRIGRDVVILDRDDLLAAESSPEAAKWLQDRQLLLPDRMPAPALAEAISQSAETGHNVSLSANDQTLCNVVAVIAGESYLGALIVYDPVTHQADRRTIERAAQIIGLLTLQREAVLNAEERVRGELVAELLASPTPATKQQRERATAREIDLDSLGTLIVVACAQDQRATASRVARRVARDSRGLAGSHLGTLVVLVPGRDPKVEAERLHHALRVNVGLPIVSCAAPIKLAEEPAREAFTLAQRSCQLLLALGARDESASVRDLAIYAMILHPARASDLKAFLDKTLGPLRAYDCDGRSDLLGTLRAYFKNSGQLTATAAELHVHVNTLLRRIERIASLIGSDWREPERALELHLAIRLCELSSAIDGPDPLST